MDLRERARRLRRESLSLIGDREAIQCDLAERRARLPYVPPDRERPPMLRRATTTPARPRSAPVMNEDASQKWADWADARVQRMLNPALQEAVAIVGEESGKLAKELRAY